MKLKCPPNLASSEARTLQILIEEVVDALIDLKIELSRTYPIEPEPEPWLTWDAFAAHLKMVEES